MVIDAVGGAAVPGVDAAWIALLAVADRRGVVSYRALRGDTLNRLATRAMEELLLHGSEHAAAVAAVAALDAAGVVAGTGGSTARGSAWAPRAAASPMC